MAFHNFSFLLYLQPVKLSIFVYVLFIGLASHRFVHDFDFSVFILIHELAYEHLTCLTILL